MARFCSPAISAPAVAPPDGRQRDRRSVDRGRFRQWHVSAHLRYQHRRSHRRTAANVTVGQLTVGASGNGTFLLTCDISTPGRTAAGKGQWITGVTLLYGAQTAAIDRK